MSEPRGLVTLDTGQEITVVKYGAYVPVSVDQLMDEGLIPDTRPPSPPVRIPWRTRLRRRVAGLRLRVGSRIAGVDLDQECECW